MRYDKEVAWKFFGDQEKARQYISQARVVAGEIFSANVNELEQVTRRVQLAGDVWCQVKQIPGQVIIEIHAAPQEEPEGGAWHGFRLQNGSQFQTEQQAIYWREQNQSWSELKPDLSRLPYNGGYTTHWGEFNGKPICLAFGGRRYDAPRDQTSFYIDGILAGTIPITNAEICGIASYNGVLVIICHHTQEPYTLFAAYRKLKRTYSAQDNSESSEYRWKTTESLSPTRFDAPIEYDLSGNYVTNLLVQTINFSENGANGIGLYTVKQQFSLSSIEYYRYYMRCTLSGSYDNLSVGMTFTPSDTYASSINSSYSYDTGGESMSISGGTECHCGFGPPPGTYNVCASASGTDSEVETSSYSVSSTYTRKHVFAVDYRGNAEVEGYYGDSYSYESCQYQDEDAYTGSYTCSWTGDECDFPYLVVTDLRYSSTTNADRRHIENSIAVLGGETIVIRDYDVTSWADEIFAYSIYRRQLECPGSACSWYVCASCNNASPNKGPEVEGQDCNVSEDPFGSSTGSQSGVQIDRYIVGFDLRYNIIIYAEVDIDVPYSGNTVTYVLRRNGQEERFLAGINWYMCPNEFYNSAEVVEFSPIGACTSTTYSSSDSQTIPAGSVNSPFLGVTYPVIGNANFPRQALAVEKNFYGEIELEMLSLYMFLRDQPVWCATQVWAQAYNRLTKYPTTQDPLCDTKLWGPCSSPGLTTISSLLPYSFTKRILESQ